MSILNLSFLKGARSAAELEQTIPRITDALAKAEAAVASLKAQREGVIFDGGPGALTKLLAEIKDAEAQVETLQIAFDGAKRRATEAEAAERNAALEARFREAQKQLPAEERRLLKQWHKAARQLADLTAEVEAVQKAIAAENSYMVEQGRRDLELPTAAAEINAKRRSMWEAHYANDRNRPVNPPHAVGLDVAHEVRIVNYYPKPQPCHDEVLPAQPLSLLD